MNGLGCGCRQSPQVLGCNCGVAGLGDVASPAFDAKRDIVAGAVAFATPWAYSSFAPKRWPKLDLWKSLGVVIVTYFGVRYAYAKSGNS